jgi:hypothetical protein
MSYEKKLDQEGLRDGEVCVMLDTGALVAVSCFVKRQINTHNPVYCATARALDNTGEPLRDAHGYVVETSIRHSACDQEVQETGDEALRRECMLLVLGEPATMKQGGAETEPTEIPLVMWDDGIRVNCGIRRAIAVAGQTSIDSSSLL